jgi:hypothetical protein
MGLFCGKCRSLLAHRIVLHKNSRKDYQDILVLQKIKDGLHECLCNRCRHTWFSKSKYARI